MTSLIAFDVHGEEIRDEMTEEVILAGDPRRSLVRYQPDGIESFVSVRLNMPLLKLAASLPAVIIKPVSRDDELLRKGSLLSVAGSVRNYQLLEDIVQEVTAAALPACYLAEQHGNGRRDFYFVTEDAVAFEQLVEAVAQRSEFPLTVERSNLSEVAPTILPREVVSVLGLDVPPHLRICPTRFEFWGAEPSLDRLRIELERLGYTYLSFETSTRELRMTKEVPIDSEFQEVLKEIVPLSRGLGCSYRGTETIDGFEQFRLGQPLPEKYSGIPTPRVGIIGRLFGRKER